MSGEAIGSAKRMTRDWQPEYLRLDLRCAMIEQLMDATSGEASEEMKYLSERRCELARVLKSMLDSVAQSDSGDGRDGRKAERKRTRRVSKWYTNPDGETRI